MELLALSSSFEPLSYLDYFNLQWTREYYQPGQFSVQIAAGDYQPDMAYLYTPNRPETGIIQKVELSETAKGRFVQLSGHFLEAMLNDKIVWPTWYGSGSLPQSVTAMLRQYQDDLPLLTVADAPAAYADEDVAWQESGGPLGDVAFTRLQTIEHSLYCRYDHLVGIITAGVWQGADRTQSQDQLPFVVFSEGFENLSAVNASLDISNHKNYAVVAGEGEGDQRKIAYADLSDGGYKQIVYVDAAGERWDPQEQTEAEYLAALQQKGLDILLKYQVVKNVDLNAASSGFTYLHDWDLGDRVDCVVETLGLSMQARIVTVREVFKKNDHTVEIELGDKKLTQLQKARMIY